MDTFKLMQHALAPLDGPPEYDFVCVSCGRKCGTVRLVTPPEHGYVLARCFDCSASDEPRSYPDTGWGI